MKPTFVCLNCKKEAESQSGPENYKGVLFLTCSLCGAKNEAIHAGSAMGHPQSPMVAIGLLK